MKKILSYFFSLIIVTTTGFADSLVFDNQTSYPSKEQKSQIAIQWAASEKEVEEANKALMYGLKQHPSSMQMITRNGTVNVTIPNKVQYFRVLVWSQGKGEPDLHTNWVDIVPNKTYTLQNDLLVPSVLMSGSGC